MKSAIRAWAAIFLEAMMIAVAAAGPLLAKQQAENSITLHPATDTIPISTFYNGTTLEVTGAVPADADLIVAVRGPLQEVHLKKKGKVGGILWMNKSDVTLRHVPSVYMIYTSGDAKTMLRSDYGMGYAACRRT